MVERLGWRTGVEVVEVVDASPAAAAGLRPEDLIVEVGGEPVTGVGDLQRLLAGELVGQAVTVVAVRDGELIRVPVVPVELEL
jgi:S1-C subfamily serine protease